MSRNTMESASRAEQLILATQPMDCGGIVLDACLFSGVCRVHELADEIYRIRCRPMSGGPVRDGFDFVRTGDNAPDNRMLQFTQDQRITSAARDTCSALIVDDSQPGTRDLVLDAGSDNRADVAVGAQDGNPDPIGGSGSAFIHDIAGNVRTGMGGQIMRISV